MLWPSGEAPGGEVSMGEGAVGRRGHMTGCSVKSSLFRILSALSLLLGVVAVGMWVRSYVGYEGMQLKKVAGSYGRPERRVVQILSSQGAVSVEYTYEDCIRRYMDPYEMPQLGKGWMLTTERKPAERLEVGGGWMGFGWRFEAQVHPTRMERYTRIVAVPYWFVVVVSGVLPAVWLRRGGRRRHRVRHGLCVNCGYDLRASGERCPECGRAKGESSA